METFFFPSLFTHGELLVVGLFLWSPESRSFPFFFPQQQILFSLSFLFLSLFSRIDARPFSLELAAISLCPLRNLYSFFSVVIIVGSSFLSPRCVRQDILRDHEVERDHPLFPIFFFLSLLLGSSNRRILFPLFPHSRLGHFCELAAAISHPFWFLLFRASRIVCRRLPFPFEARVGKPFLLGKNSLLFLPPPLFARVRSSRLSLRGRGAGHRHSF